MKQKKKTTDELQAQANKALNKLARLSELMQPTDCPFEAKRQLAEIEAMEVGGAVNCSRVMSENKTVTIQQE